jgi:predicted metal-dependent phosphoesterase TrpH
MIDLHTHSTFSDGSETPAALVATARVTGLRGLALTDHDTADGCDELLAACRAQGVTGFSGVEVSAEVSGGTLHVLGYGIDPHHPDLAAKLLDVRDGRASRNRLILARLAELGCPMDWEEVAAFAGEEVVGRPHFARAMIARGYVASVQEAFDRFLAKGKPAYMDRLRFPPEECIRLVRAAGGVAVLAHPFTWEPDSARLAERLTPLVEAGLGGIEAYYTEHTLEQQIVCLRLAQRHGLLVTGGTDAHGSVTPDRTLGRGRGGLEVPDALLGPLLDALAGSRWVAGEVNGER